MVNCITRFIFRFYLDFGSYERKILNSITYLFFSTLKNEMEWRKKLGPAVDVHFHRFIYQWWCITIFVWFLLISPIVSHSHPSHWQVYNFNPYIRATIVSFFSEVCHFYAALFIRYASMPSTQWLTRKIPSTIFYFVVLFYEMQSDFASVFRFAAINSRESCETFDSLDFDEVSSWKQTVMAQQTSDSDSMFL